MKLLHINITEAIALKGDISFRKLFVKKMASVKLATVTSSIKGFHVYRRSPDIGEKLKCVLEEIIDTLT